jgi:excisionase family DNA binding protein
MPNTLTTREVCDRLKMSRQALYAAVKAGTVPVHRIRPGGRLRFIESEILEATRRNGQPAPAEVTQK